MIKRAFLIVMTALLSIVLMFGSTSALSEEAAAGAILTKAEIGHLRFIREEEKLARDVYNVLAEKWESRILRKIAESEQRHTDAVRAVIEEYVISDPAKATPPGIFANAELQSLYGALVEQGSASLIDALKVGALTEEKDIFDINLAVKDTIKDDLKAMYAYLKEGSSIHLRGFVAEIRKAGGEYSPQFIDRGEYERVLKL